MAADGYLYQPLTWADNTTGFSTMTYTSGSTNAYPVVVGAPAPPPEPKEPTLIEWLRGRVTEITEMAWAA